jgi:hypothetical protein
MRWGEGAIERRCRQGAAVDLDHRHVDVPSRVQPLPPEAFSPVVQRNRKPRRLGQVVRVDVQLDLDAVGKMPARLVEQHMPAGHQKQPLAAREEKTTRVGQWPLLFESADARGREKNAVRTAPRHPGVVCCRHFPLRVCAPQSQPGRLSRRR